MRPRTLLLLAGLAACDRNKTAPPAASTPPPPAVPAPASSAASAPGAAPSRVAKANVVFILVDDLSTDLVQYMPHVQAMQKDGATFSRYFVTDSLCCPSRTSIFTGRFPHSSGVFTNDVASGGGYAGYMSNGNDKLSFAVSLREAGYRTALLGKYLNGYLPKRDGVALGWTEWRVAGAGYPEFDYNLNENGKLVHYGTGPEDYLTDVVAGLASDFVKAPTAEPFFVEVATFAPHAPSTPAPRDAAAFQGLTAPRPRSFGARPDASSVPWLQHILPLAPPDVAHIDGHYRKRAQSVLAVDAMIGRLRADVAARGAADSTYFFFSSDNGFHLGEHSLRGGEMTAFDTDIRVPLVVVGPGVAPGSVIDAVTENVDLCPTFDEIGGAPIPSAAEGKSLLPLLGGTFEGQWRRWALVEHRGPNLSPDDPDLPAAHSGNPPTYAAIRSSDDTIFVEYADGSTEYYDIRHDPDELHNVVSSLPTERTATLQAILHENQGCHGAEACWKAQTRN